MIQRVEPRIVVPSTSTTATSESVPRYSGTRSRLQSDGSIADIATIPIPPTMK